MYAKEIKRILLTNLLQVSKEHHHHGPKVVQWPDKKQGIRAWQAPLAT
jgi:hypothetical protein